MKNTRGIGFYTKLVLLMIFGLAAAGWAAVKTGLVRPYTVTDPYTPWDLAYYLDAAQQVWIRPGLKIEIRSVTIPDDRRPVATVKIVDDRGFPLDREGNLTPGTVSLSFIFSRIEPGESQYTAYTTRIETSPTDGATAIQAASDSGGTYRILEDGVYEYKFKTALPPDFKRSATHTLGVYGSRDLRDLGLSRYVSNVTYDFVPDGSPVQVIRDVVRTQTCNKCHDTLSAHGGVRQDVRLCILCHQPQSVDAETGNTVDFNVMIHKIHRGADLPSVKAGRPYRIVGFGQQVSDYSTVHFPQDLRNCETCHQQGTQSINYALKPTRAVCGSCHDDINFATGEKHAGGPQVSDRLCASCHIPEGDLEFDASIKGAHTVPMKSKQLPGVNFDIVNVANTGPGQNPTVTFTIKDKAGNLILPNQMDLLALVLAGPTADYAQSFREDAKSATASEAGYAYTFTNAIPAEAKGTFAVGIEGYRNATLNAGTTKQMAIRDVGYNKIAYIPVTDPAPIVRRTIVDQANCNACHETLAAHGTIRRNVAYCVLCHNPNTLDEGRRPTNQFPPESIQFTRMIHKIHRGEELKQPFTIFGFGNRPISFNEVRFPGILKDCRQCHTGNSHTIPLSQGVLPTQTPRDFLNPTRPVATACLACHDTSDAAAHAAVNTASFGESCAVCHKESAEFAVTRMHAR